MLRETDTCARISDEGRLVDRYDKRKCSHTELTRCYTPGFEPVVFDVDGFRFGLAICLEINFSEVLAEYDRLGVDCLLLSAYPVDSIFATKARAYARIHNYWLSLSVPAQARTWARPIGVMFGRRTCPHGSLREPAAASRLRTFVPRPEALDSARLIP